MFVSRGDQRGTKLNQLAFQKSNERRYSHITYLLLGLKKKNKQKTKNLFVKIES